MDTPADLTFEVGASPHIAAAGVSTRNMMLDVVIGLSPVMGVAIFQHGASALWRILLAAGACMAAEAAFEKARGRAHALTNGSAALTGLLLALSLPHTAPVHMILLGSLVAIGLGKSVFGGLGQNLFNPAMVGRAFVSVAFPASVSGAAYLTDGTTGATPLNAFKADAGHAGLSDLFLGAAPGSLGEVSALACLAGGLYLILRKSASWQIPLSMLSTLLLLGILRHAAADTPESWKALSDLFAGAAMFGAFFIATDPVSSPLSHKGRILFGAGVGFLTWFFRTFSGYPEGVMFAILLMNATTPLINQFLIPKPTGAAS
jgi:electron transport complex protein RnfD